MGPRTKEVKWARKCDCYFGRYFACFLSSSSGINGFNWYLTFNHFVKKYKRCPYLIVYLGIILKIILKMTMIVGRIIQKKRRTWLLFPQHLKHESKYALKYFWFYYLKRRNPSLHTDYLASVWVQLLGARELPEVPTRTRPIVSPPCSLVNNYHFSGSSPPCLPCPKSSLKIYFRFNHPSFFLSGSSWKKRIRKIGLGGFAIKQRWKFKTLRKN